MSLPEEIADLLSKKMEKVQEGDLEKYKSSLNSIFDDSVRSTIKYVLGVNSHGYEIRDEKYREKLRSIVSSQIDKYIEEYKNTKIEDLREIFTYAYKTHLKNLIRQAAVTKAEEDFNNFIGDKK